MAHPEDERQALGTLLASARDEAGFSLSSAAQELTDRGYPIHKATIGAWEKGRNLPDALWLRRLARLYDRTIDSLLAQEPPPPKWPLSPELYEKVLRLSGEELSKLENVLRAHLGLSLQNLSQSGNQLQLIHGKPKESAYSDDASDQSGGLAHTEIPTRKRHASPNDQRTARGKGGRRA